MMPRIKFREFDYRSSESLTRRTTFMLKVIIFFCNARHKAIEKITQICKCLSHKVKFMPSFDRLCNSEVSY